MMMQFSLVTVITQNRKHTFCSNDIQMKLCHSVQMTSRIKYHQVFTNFKTNITGQKERSLIWLPMQQIEWGIIFRFSLKYATKKDFYKTLVSCPGWNEYRCSNKSIGFPFDLFELALKTTPIKNPCSNSTRWYGVMWLQQCGVVWFGVAWCLCIISLFVQTMYHFCLNTHKLHVFPI